MSRNKAVGSRQVGSGENATQPGVPRPPSVIAQTVEILNSQSVPVPPLTDEQAEQMRDRLEQSGEAVGESMGFILMLGLAHDQLPPPQTGFVGRKYDLRLSERQASALARLTTILDENDQRLSGGAHVGKSRPKAMQWLLDRLADAFDPPAIVT